MAAMALDMRHTRGSGHCSKASRGGINAAPATRNPNWTKILVRRRSNLDRSPPRVCRRTITSAETRQKLSTARPTCTGNRTLRVSYQDPPARHSDELSVDGANPVGYRRLDRGWARASGIILDVTAAEARGTKPTFGIFQCTKKPRKSGVAEGSIRLILPTSCRRRGSGILATRAVRLS